MTAHNRILAATAAAILLAGCGGTSESGPTASPSPGAPSMTDAQAPPERLVIDVTIEGGEVTPTNAQLSAAVGQPIVIKVSSDSAD